ncbi:MAG: GNAT family N-acetyltransferase [Deltaproteobacteria bacterium]|nr:GNAT family N-acetyltransferase [Deltaproteobacteria bacterium]
MSHNLSTETELVGYFPGVVGRIIEEHATYYHQHWGFDISFETQVGRELSEFMCNFKEGRDGFWVAGINNKFAGAVAIDGRQTGDAGVRLRWFIVSPEFQGRRIGLKLLRQAVSFCREAGYKRVFLWTFQGLDQARRLYELAGFRLTEEHAVTQWGTSIVEQKFELEI